VLAGDEGRAAAVLHALQDPARRLKVELSALKVHAIAPRRIAAGGEEQDPFFARIWVDLTDVSRARLFITDRGWRRVCVRTLQLEGGFDEVFLEQLAFVVRVSLEAFAAGELICVARQDFARSLEAPRSPPSTVEPRRVEPSPPAWHLAASSALGVQAFGAQGAVTAGPELAIGLSRASWAGKLAGQWRSPARLDASSVHVDLQALALRLDLTRRTKLSASWWAGGVASLGVEVMRSKAHSQSSRLVLDRPAWNVEPLARAGMSVGRYWGSAYLGLTLGVELGLARVRYVVVSGANEPETLFARAPARPFAAVELGL
jgi:hypothetical protein